MTEINNKTDNHIDSITDSKHIWLLNHYAVPPSRHGGTRHHDLAVQLNRKGFKTTIFCSGNPHWGEVDRMPDKVKYIHQTIDGVSYVFINTKPVYNGNGIKRLLNMISFSFFMKKFFRRFERPDIVIGSSVHLFAVTAAGYIARKTGATFICETRDLWSESMIRMGGLSRFHPMVLMATMLEKKTYRAAKKIIVLMPNASEFLKRYGIEESKIIHIPNGVDIHRFDALKNNTDSPTLPELLRKTLENEFCCVYTGAHGIPNSLETLLKASEILQDSVPQIKFVMVGDGPVKKDLIREAEVRGIKNLLFFDSVTKETIPAILNKSRINLVAMRDMPLYRYGMSLNKLFDYMCSGKPIVFAGNVYNDLVQEAGCGISVPPESPQKFAAAVETLYNMSAPQRTLLGQKGRTYVETNHNMEKLADKLIRIL